jgi:hypothetical protein
MRCSIGTVMSRLFYAGASWRRYWRFETSETIMMDGNNN